MVLKVDTDLATIATHFKDLERPQWGKNKNFTATTKQGDLLFGSIFLLVCLIMSAILFQLFDFNFDFFYIRVIFG